MLRCLRSRCFGCVFAGAQLSLLAAAQSPNREQDSGRMGEAWAPSPADKVIKISGVYPHLAVFNPYGECGIGAVAPWANKLWFMTYPPHFPEGSADKLYAVDASLRLDQRPESVGGTHANRMIHQESRQLVLGPYLISENGQVRAVDPHKLRARLTATTRHLTDPANKVLFFGMERELYELDVKTLETTRIYGEMQGPFPGYHGKGATVSDGQLIVANNGEKGWDIKKDPQFFGPAGGLAESDGKDWSRPFKVIERSNFTEVTGPGGIYGQASGDDRVWATGWDKRSVIVKLRERGKWHTFRLPKASYTHDALHGWYTEWPRIREVTDGRWLMHMHGLFYEFPKTFSAANTDGLRPISSYLKMPVDYCGWNSEIVMACDDASVMQNPLAGQSHSNLQFLQWSELEKYGAPAGWGGVWVQDEVRAKISSDPFLVNGFTQGVLHVKHEGATSLPITIEADPEGRGTWKSIGAEMVVPGEGYAFRALGPMIGKGWLRLTPQADSGGVTAYWHVSNELRRADRTIFTSLLGRSAANRAGSNGIIKPAEGDARTLLFAASILNTAGAQAESALYTMDGSLQLRRADDPAREKVLRVKFGVNDNTPPVHDTFDDASVVVTEGGQRFRLPFSSKDTSNIRSNDYGAGVRAPRTKREVVTERFLFQANGTFYELPRESAGGLRRIRPVCTHDRAISDFASWRGMLVLAGVSEAAFKKDDPHVICSDDKKAALWLGEVDDLWQLGAPRGMGGPWCGGQPLTAAAPAIRILWLATAKNVS